MSNTNITTIENQAFYGCGFKTINLPQTITTIEESCFEICKYLESIVIPDNVSILEKKCFANCNNLSIVYLPIQLTKIDTQCFLNCISLSEIYCKKQSINDVVFNSAFDNIKTNGIIYGNYDNVSDYDKIMGTSISYLGYYGWTLLPLNPDE